MAGRYVPLYKLITGHQINALKVASALRQFARSNEDQALNILLIGSGGREHALAWALSASSIVTKLYCAPGNAGIAEAAECVPIPVTDLDRLVAFAKESESISR